MGTILGGDRRDIRENIKKRALLQVIYVRIGKGMILHEGKWVEKPRKFGLRLMS